MFQSVELLFFQPQGDRYKFLVKSIRKTVTHILFEVDGENNVNPSIVLRQKKKRTSTTHGVYLWFTEGPRL